LWNSQHGRKSPRESEIRASHKQNSILKSLFQQPAKARISKVLKFGHAERPLFGTLL
jgi:hypothetical protein